MKKITLSLYNYGTITKIANFSNNGHDAVKCMICLNDSEVKAHGVLPESIFYFLDYTINKREVIYIDYTGNDKKDSLWRYVEKVSTIRQFSAQYA